LTLWYFWLESSLTPLKFPCAIDLHFMALFASLGVPVLVF